MKTVATLATYSALTLLSACATIIEGSSDTINIATTPPTNATCSLANQRGTYNSYAPSQTTVQKSRSDLNVSCVDPRSGASGKSTIVSDVEPWAFGNILLGGIIGLGIDWTTGAAYNYPESATVPMSMPTAYAPAYGNPVATTAQPASAYQQPAPTYQQTAPAYQQPAAAPYYAPAPTMSAPAQQAAPQYQYIPPSQLGNPTYTIPAQQIPAAR